MSEFYDLEFEIASNTEKVFQDSYSTDLYSFSINFKTGENFDIIITENESLPKNNNAKEDYFDVVKRLLTEERPSNSIGRKDALVKFKDVIQTALNERNIRLGRNEKILELFNLDRNNPSILREWLDLVVQRIHHNQHEELSNLSEEEYEFYWHLLNATLNIILKQKS